MKTGVLIFCLGKEGHSVKALKKELSNFEIISFKYKPDKNLTGHQAETEEAKARNRALLELEYFDYLITLDSNEFIFKKDAEKIKKYLEDNNPSLVLVNRKLYSENNKVNLTDSHTPIIAVNPREVKFYLKRCARAGKGAFLNKVTVHDFSLLNEPFSKKQICSADAAITNIIKSFSFKTDSVTKKRGTKKSIVESSKQKTEGSKL